MAADNEHRLVSKVIRDRNIVPVLQRGITDAWFLDDDNKKVWSFVRSHYAEYNEVPTATTVKDHYPNFEILNVEDTVEYLLDTIVEFRRRLLTRQGVEEALTDLQGNNHESALIAMAATVERVNLQGNLGTHEMDLSKNTDERYQEYLELQKHEILGVHTGFAKIDEATAGLQGGQLVTIVASPKTGKANSLDTPVLTPTGWSTMGALQVGDSVVGPDGLPTRVLAVHDQGIKDLYKVTLDDGGSTEACSEHLWAVIPHGQAKKVLTTLEIQTKIRTNSRLAYLPTLVAPEYPTAETYVDPWLIGMLIGDGHYAKGQSVSLTNIDPLVIQAVKETSPTQVTSTRDGLCHHLYTPRGQSNPVVEALKSLGVRGQVSQTKRLPEGFLLWSIEQRKRLLAGLLDSDGCLSGRSVEHYTAVPEMALQVQQLVWSLGGTSRISQRSRFYVKGGTRHPARDCYTNRMRLPYGNPFLFSLRALKYDDQPTVARPVSRRIASVEFSRRAPARCITVAREDGLYITKDYIVTHNSQVALQMAINVHSLGKVPMFMSYEMNNREQQQRYDAMISHISHTRLRRGKLHDSEEARYIDALNATEDKTSFHLVDAIAGLTVSALSAKISMLNPDVVFVDGVYLMLDEVTGESGTPQSLTNITRSLKRLAQKLDKPIIATTQALLWKMKGTKVSQGSLGYSSSFLQDSDVVLGLEVIEEDEEVRLLKIIASRSCPPSETTLTWRWETGCFHDETEMMKCKYCMAWGSR